MSVFESITQHNANYNYTNKAKTMVIGGETVKVGTPLNFHQSFYDIYKANAKTYKQNLQTIKLNELVSKNGGIILDMSGFQDKLNKYEFDNVEFLKLQNTSVNNQYHFYKALSQQDEDYVKRALNSMNNHYQDVMIFAEKYSKEGEYLTCCEEAKNSYEKEMRVYEKFKNSHWFRIRYLDLETKKSIKLYKFVKKFGYEGEDEFLKNKKKYGLKLALGRIE